MKQLSLLTKCCNGNGFHIRCTFQGSRTTSDKGRKCRNNAPTLAARVASTGVQTAACGAQSISQARIGDRPRLSQGWCVDTRWVNLSSRSPGDGEGMVQTANRTLELRTASAAAKSARLKRPMRVRLYPRAPRFAPALSCRHRHRYVSSLPGM